MDRVSTPLDSMSQPSSNLPTPLPARVLATACSLDALPPARRRRGSSDGFAALVITFMLLVLSLTCLLCWDLTHKEWEAVGLTLQAFGVYNTSSPAIYTTPALNETAASMGDAPPPAAPHSLMWLVVSHQLLHVAWWLFEGAAIATGACAAFFALCFMWPNIWCGRCWDTPPPDVSECLLGSAAPLATEHRRASRQSLFLPPVLVPALID